MQANKTPTPLSPEERRRWFPDDFFAELDSWFSTDIACCDQCHDEFVAIWPHAYSSDDGEFQKAGIPLTAFYDGSRLRQSYTMEEFCDFVGDLSCPRCGGELTHNVWPYNLPFSVEPGFEEAISEIAKLAEETPFLILKHAFADRVLSAISRLGMATSETHFGKSLFRARSGLVPEEASQFALPPANVVREGRYNHAGCPVLYLGSDEETCIEEMRRATCTIAEIEVTRPLKVLDLHTSETSHPQAADVLATLAWSALMSAKQSSEGWHRPAYVFSRFVADCARASGFHAIKYPSTRISKTGNFNLVIIDRELCLKGIKIRRCTRYSGD